MICKLPHFPDSRQGETFPDIGGRAYTAPVARR